MTPNRLGTTRCSESDCPRTLLGIVTLPSTGSFIIVLLECYFERGSFILMVGRSIDASVLSKGEEGLKANRPTNPS